MPTHRTIDEHIARLDEIDLATLGNDLHNALEIDRKHPSIPDGYPRATLGASPPTGRPHHHNDDENENVDLTSVEAAYVARTGRHRDEYHDTLNAAIGYLGDAERALRAAKNKAAELVQLQDARGLAGTEPGCWVMARIGKWEPVFRTTDAAGILDLPRALGRWAYRFIADNERLPTIDECRAHADGKRIHVKAS